MSADTNPYEVPAFQPPMISKRSGVVSKKTLIPAALMAFVGTCFAGSAFGLFAGILGIIFGFVFALVAAVPSTVIVFVLAGIFCGPEIQRWKVVCFAATSGGLSGLAACAWLMGLSAEAIAMGVIAASIGACFSGFAAWLCVRVADSPQPMPAPQQLWGDLNVPPGPHGQHRGF